MGFLETVLQAIFPNRKLKSNSGFTDEEIRLIQIAQSKSPTKLRIACKFKYLDATIVDGGQYLVLGSYEHTYNRSSNIVVNDHIYVNSIVNDLSLGRDARLIVLAHELGHLLIARENPVLEQLLTSFIKESMAHTRGGQLLRELGEVELAERILKMPAGEISLDVR